MKVKRIYLAGPQVFLRNPAAVADAKKKLCSKYGFEGVFPLDQELDLAGMQPEEQARQIFLANINLMDSCDIIVADMTPYRGESMDVGTAFEMGYMYSRSKAVFGYSNSPNSFAERSRISGELTERTDEPGVFEDANGMRIENFGSLTENLMCACSPTIDPVVIDPDAYKQIVPSELYENLSAFEKCLLKIKKSDNY